MLGAVIGDILASPYEKLSHLESRKLPTPTDDTFLTCACQDWLLENKDTNLSIIEHPEIQKFLLSSAIRHLKKWGNMFPESGFSKHFSAWVKEKNFRQTERQTNGCLMRQSPIAKFCITNGLNLTTALNLSKIFASPTHNHQDSYLASELHITILYKILSKELNTDNIKTFLTNNHKDLQSSSFWFDANQKEFIYDAKRTLTIALSAIYYSNSFDETIQFCIDCGGDTDTYAAVAGPIAEALWGISLDTILKTRRYTKKYSQIRHFYPHIFNGL